MTVIFVGTVLNKGILLDEVRKKESIEAKSKSLRGFSESYETKM